MVNAQIEWVAETEDRKFGKVVAPWDKQVEVFKGVGAEIVLPEDAVDAGFAGYNSPSRTRLIAVKVRGKNTILYKGSELTTLAGAEEIVKAHANGRYPTRPTYFYDYLEDIAKTQEGDEPKDRTAIVLSRYGTQFWGNETPEAKFTLGPRANQYFKDKLEPLGIREIPFFDLLADLPKCSILNYVRFVGDPQCGSLLICVGQNLHLSSSALGVLEKTVEGGSREAVNYPIVS